MKIMFTSVGRRVELVQEFKAAAKKLNIDLTVVGADISDTAPALFFCDESKLICRIHDSQYIPQLLSICKAESVDCLIPTIDTDLLLLSKNKKKFEEIGTKVLIGALEKVKLCRNKILTTAYFKSIGLHSPEAYDSVDSYLNREINVVPLFPAFIKPKDGSSSINAYKVENEEELHQYAEKIDNFIIQPFITGREYTIDILCDYEGNPVYITPRERLAVRTGEVIKTQIVQDDKMIQEMKLLLADFKPSGPITVQLIRDNKTGEDFYIEINPRFGGGAPLSMKAGADSASAILRMLRGERVCYSPKSAKNGTIYSRFDQSVCVSEGND